MIYIMIKILICIIGIYTIQGCHGSFICDHMMSTPLCPGEIVSCTCVVSGTTSNTRWVFTSAITLCAFNFIGLSQIPPCAPPASQSTGNCGPYLNAANRDFGNNTPCNTSVLTVKAHYNLSGLMLACMDFTSPGLSIGNASIIIQAPPISPTASVTANNPYELTLNWTTPISGGVPTSYNVSINDSSSTTIVIPEDGSPLHTHTFTRLMSDTVYTVSMIAINCAGTSNVTSERRLTVADPPNSSSINVMFIIEVNRTLSLLYITWTPVGGSVTIYKARIVGDGVTIGNSSTNCINSTCSLTIHSEKSDIPTTYSIFVSSINGYGNVGPESSSNFRVINYIKAVSYDTVSASIQCSFEDIQSLYCVVCCSPDPSLPPDSSVYNISISRGTEVTVHLDDLTSDQVYYCKAAATINNSYPTNCTIPGFKGVNSVITFKTKTPVQDMTNSGTRTPPAAIIIPLGITVVIIISVVVFFSVYWRKKAHQCTPHGNKDTDVPKRCVTTTKPQTTIYDDVIAPKKITAYEDINALKTYPKHGVDNTTVHTYSSPCKQHLKSKPLKDHSGNTNNSLKNVVVTTDISQYNEVLITGDDYSVSRKETLRHIKRADNAVTQYILDAYSEPVQVIDKEALSCTTNGGYALPVDHRGLSGKGKP